MLLSEAFFSKEDLEQALRENGYDELVPYYRLIFDNEKQYVMTASCAEPYIGIYQIPDSDEVLVFTPGPRDEVEYKMHQALPEGSKPYLFRIDCAELMIISLRGH